MQVCDGAFRRTELLLDSNIALKLSNYSVLVRTSRLQLSQSLVFALTAVHGSCSPKHIMQRIILSHIMQWDAASYKRVYIAPSWFFAVSSNKTSSFAWLDYIMVGEWKSSHFSFLGNSQKKRKIAEEHSNYSFCVHSCSFKTSLYVDDKNKLALRSQAQMLSALIPSDLGYKCYCSNPHIYIQVYK